MKIVRAAVVGAGALAMASLAFAQGPAKAQGQAGDEAAKVRLHMAPRLAEIARGGSLEGVFVEVEDMNKEVLRRAKIWPNGVTIWNRERQFQLPEAGHRRILKMLADSAFLDIPDSAGAWPGVKPPAVKQWTRGITLTIGELSKYAGQSNKGAQSEAYTKLVRSILAIIEPHAAKGVTAASLQEGVAKLAGGELAAEAFSLMVSSPQLPELGEKQPAGWLARVDGRVLIARPHSVRDGFGPEEKRPLTDEEWKALLSVVAGAHPEAWPASLNVPGYTDLAVTVLNHSVSTQARSFSGASTTAQEAAAAFVSLRRHVARLAGPVAAGVARPTTAP
ncbi:MAG: hypothetical protein ACOY3Y_01720 [Acidobacteriota bacterium]